MRKARIVGLLLGFVGVVLLAGCATQAQKPAQEATPEQKARSSVASAFMTGTAPEILSEKVALGPELQARLGLPPGTDGAKIYDALLGLSQGATPKISEATPEEAQRSPEHSPPLFTLSAGDLKLLLHYDLQGNHVDFVESLSAPPIAAATPVAEAATPAPVAEPAAPVPMAEPATPAPAAEPAKSEPGQTVYSVVEPKAPSKARAKRKAQTKAKPKALAKAKPQPRATQVRTAQAGEPQSSIPALEPPPLKPSGPCVIKPVMTDQDLVNCGATPPRY